MLADLGKALEEEKAEKARLEKQLRDCKARIEQTEQQLIEQLTMAGLDSFTANNHKFTPTTTIYASCPEEDRPALFAVLREQGSGDLVKETINGNTLSAWVRDRLEHGVPIPPQIKTHPKTVVRVEKLK